MIKTKQLIKEFLEHLEIELSRSNKTIENYAHYLMRFLEWSKAENPEKISLDLVRQYRLYLNRYVDKYGEPLQKTTQNYHIIALRGFLRYLAKRDISSLSAEKLEIGKNPEREIEFLTPEELDRLLGIISGQDLRSLRDKAILELLFSAGLRVSELVSIDRDQINLENQEFSVRGKGEKVRIVFISDTAKRAIENYINKRRDIDPALFIRLSNNMKEKEDLRMTTRSVQRIVKKIFS